MGRQSVAGYALLLFFCGLVTLVLVLPLAAAAGKSPTSLVLYGLMTLVFCAGAVVIVTSTWVDVAFWGRVWAALSVVTAVVVYLTGLASLLGAVVMGALGWGILMEVLFLVLQTLHDCGYIR